MKNLFIFSVDCLLGFLSLSTFAQNSVKHNVLVIIVDDLRPEVAAYGDQIAHTPNIDYLAETGGLFENAFTAVPVCGASRAALLSGKKPTTNRFVDYNSRLDIDLPKDESLPNYFKDNGY